MKRTKPTYKQELVIRDVMEKVNQGKPMKIVESVEKFYNVKNRKSAEAVMIKNLKNETFREALMSSLVEKRILGADSKTEDVLLDGLDAVDPKGNVNYDTRLRYVQEINKIAGIYAVEVKKNLNLNVDMTEEELDRRIAELQEQVA